MTTGAVRSIRDEQRDLTRERILHALADRIARDGIADFSVQDVADDAGVSHRTVYRHFPSRDALLEALSVFLDAELGRRGAPGVPHDLETLRRGPLLVFPYLDDLETLARAMVVLSQGGQIRSRAQEERTRAFQRLVDEAFPHVDAAQRGRAAAVMRHLNGSRTWFELREVFGMTGQEAGEAAAWAVGVLVDEMTKNERAAKRSARDEHGAESKTSTSEE